MYTATDDSQVKITRKSLKLLFDRLKQHKKWLFIGFAALICVDALQIMVPKIFQVIIDGITSGQATAGYLWSFVGLIMGIALVICICRFCWRYFIVGASHKLEFLLRQDLYNHLQKLPSQYFDATKVGDIMAHASNDITAIRMATGIAALASFDALFLAIASISLMIAMDAQLTLLTLLPLPVLTLTILRFGKVLHRRFRQVQAAFSRLSEKAQESFSGIRVIKAYGDTRSEDRLFAERAQDCADWNIRLGRIWSFIEPLIGGMAFTSMAILLGVGGRKVIHGELSLGQFVAFSSYLNLLLWPMLAIGWVINLLQRGTASMDRLQTIFTTDPAIQDGPATRPPEPAIAVNGLTFRYPNTRTDVLRDIGFTLPAGQTLGITGRTGAGKTTLVELLSRLYDPPAGMIAIGGQDIHHLRLSDLRGLFGYVPQETFLFAMTVAENLAFGCDGLSPEAMTSLARTVAIHDEIIQFPKGYDTLVGERGISLSGGQKQRIAIARALAINPQILVLDDALSNVDTETEAAILSALKTRLADATNIVISHRISTISHADQILVLDKGKVAQHGTHDSLLSEHGFYAELYRMQLLEEEARGDAQRPDSGGEA